MSEYELKPVDFENPSALFVLEDMLKGLIGGPLLYNSYFKAFGFSGLQREQVGIYGEI